MAKSKVQAVLDQDGVKLSSTARSRIVATFSDALSSLDNSGSVVTTLCNTLHQAFAGAEVPADEMELIVSEIASKRGWKDSTLKTRSSEMRVVLKSYDKLPEVIKGIVKQIKSCDFHRAIRAGRRVVAGDSIEDAITEVCTEKEGKKVTKQARVEAALRSWFKATPRKRDVILQACATLGLKIKDVNA